MIEIMTQSQNGNANQRIKAFLPTMVHGHRTCHYTQAKRPDRGRHHETVNHRAMAERNRAQQDRQRQADFVEKRTFENAPRAGQYAKHHGSNKAMRNAQTR